MKNHFGLKTVLFIVLAGLLLIPLGIKSQNKEAFVVRSGESRFGIPTPFMGVNPNDLKLSTKDTDGRLSAFYYLGIQKAGPSFHVHLAQDEAFFVLDGEYIFQLDNEKTVLKKGDLIFLPRGLPHTWIQKSDKGELFYFLQPAGKMEEFFVAMTSLGVGSTEQQREKIGKDSGIKNVGPGLVLSDTHQLVSKLSNGFLVRAGEGRFDEKTVLNGVNTNDIKISGKDTGGELSVFEYAGNEKGGPPMHLHHHQDEIFYISEGQYLFQCGEQKYDLQKGDMIFLPRGIPHTWAQKTDTGKLLFFFQPAGKMEEFFRQVQLSHGAVNPTDGAAMFENHDMKITGPPIAY